MNPSFQAGYIGNHTRSRELKLRTPETGLPANQSANVPFNYLD